MTMKTSPGVTDSGSRHRRSDLPPKRSWHVVLTGVLALAAGTSLVATVMVTATSLLPDSSPTPRRARIEALGQQSPVSIPSTKPSTAGIAPKPLRAAAVTPAHPTTAQGAITARGESSSSRTVVVPVATTRKPLDTHPVGLTVPPKATPTRAEPPKPPKPRPSKSAPPKATPPQATPPKATPPKATPPVADPPKANAPTVAPPAADPPKADPPKADPPKADPPKADPPKADPQPATPSRPAKDKDKNPIQDLLDGIITVITGGGGHHRR